MLALRIMVSADPDNAVRILLSDSSDDGEIVCLVAFARSESCNAGIKKNSFFIILWF